MQAKQAKQILQLCVAGAASVLSAATIAQPRPCSSFPPAERVLARVFGDCSDAAPIVDVRQDGSVTATDIAVTNVVGLSFDEARSQLARFNVQRSYRASAEPGGTVLSQQPAPPARLAAGAVVRVTLSDGSLRPSPEVPGSQVDGVRPPTAAAESLPPPAAETQSVNAGSIARGSDSAADRDATRHTTATATRPLELTRDDTTVPNVVGLSIKRAQARLTRFNIERSDRYSQAPVGSVIEQSPPPSTRIAAGQPISIVVSRGPQPAAATEFFELPKLVDRNVNDAAGVLAEFKVNRVDVVSAAPLGTIVGQSPAAGTSVPPGSAVALHVSDGSLAAAATPAVAHGAPAPAAAGATSAANELVPSTVIGNTETGTQSPATVADPSAAPAAPAVAVEASGPVAPPGDEQALRLANTELTIGTAIFLTLFLIALLVRQWLGRRHQEPPTVAPEPAPVVPAVVSLAPAPREMRFAARFQAGDVKVSFGAASDPEEAVEEYSTIQHG